jgi:AcrR family transcriptional regulator
MSKAEQTKAFIIEKTAPIFNSKGYAGTSLNDMTAATGLTKGSIYGNFTGKDEVALDVFDYNWKRVTSMVKQEMSKRKTAREKLLSYVSVFSTMPKLFPPGGCPLLNTATESDDTHPLLRNKAIEAFAAWKAGVVSIIEKGVENNEFTSADIDPEQVALTLIAVIEGGIMIGKLTGKNQYLKAVMKSAEKMITAL